MWTSNGGNTWTYTDGQSTNLTAKIMNDTLYIMGTGVDVYKRQVSRVNNYFNRIIASVEAQDNYQNGDDVTFVGNFYYKENPSE